ncbi:hypothetical protein C4D60_Mb03t11510 [Musa balbisiana]|uniref:PHD-type domain-containing protein n=1 Tax=Musa balbisiana TaxID=52838 RepID=A0A4V4H616_MUSBA|nr:hypothetical protein C4D60_Mb03t11510 [Musa balbisiana]
MDPAPATASKTHEVRLAPLFIDLNEAPPPPCDTPPADPPSHGFSLDPRALACRYHASLAPAPGPAADFPGEAGVGQLPLLCGVCGRPETRGGTVVCDGCERGFHVGCVRNRLRYPAAAVDDWLCHECSASGRPTKRWTLGAARLLDINALPPSEGDVEELQSSGNVGCRQFFLHSFSPVNNVDVANVSGSGQPFPQHVGQIRNDCDLAKDTGSVDDFSRITEDGKRFGSGNDVAHYLGIKSSYTYVDIGEKSDVSGVVQRSLPPRRRKRDLSRTWTATSSSENQESVRVNCGGEPSSDNEVMESQYSDFRRPSRVTNAYTEENNGHGSQILNGCLPVQYEDFFVICFGRIDLRLAYHNNCQIWPVGYRSVWHDRITGSIFECEVSDGGDAGPVFKVRRHPCSALPIPIGQTVLLYNNANKCDASERTETNSVILESDLEKDDDIIMLLSDPSYSDLEQVSCFSGNLCGNSHGTSTQMEVDEPDGLNSHSEKFDDSSVRTSTLRDEIGDFYVEGRSSFSVWKMVSQTLVDSCREVYKQSGSLQFTCRHRNQISSSLADNGRPRLVDHLGTLARFCSSAGPTNMPQVIQNHTEFDLSCQLVAEWLNQDRFGLDMGFVKEVIETFPESHACSGYQFLANRADFSKSMTVASGVILAVQRNGDGAEDKVPSYGLYRRQMMLKQQDFAADHQLSDRQPPPGKPCSRRLPAELVGDVYQIWEFLWRFYGTLGLYEPPTLEELEEELIDPWPIDSKYMEKLEKEIDDFREPDGRISLSTCESGSTASEVSPFMFIPNETASAREAAQAKLASRTYGRCTGVMLTKIHISLLKILIGEILGKVTVYLDPNSDARESRSRRGRKKDVENTVAVKEAKTEILPANELTWPDLARRYILAVLSMNFVMDSPDVFTREGLKLVRCLQGDGGVLCGSLSGVAGMEADAMLLADAERQISDSRLQENKVLPVDQKDSDAVSTSEPAVVNGNNLPEWALPLEPVKKLPTNVGTRIRKCIYDALDRNPPEWAKKILEHSISKEVYKGNASGPTKKAVLSVLAEASGGKHQQKSEKRSKEKSPISLSDAVMKRCRIVLRRAVSADEGKVFCNLLGSPIANVNDNEDEGVLGFPAMVSRPLDFRTIDLRLAVGAYGGSHEAFLEDVREVWHNISTAYGDRPDLMQLVETLSQKFESLYEKEVLILVEKIADHVGNEPLDTEKRKELYNIILAANEIPKAPWEEGVCKVCGIDKDDDSVLLCDSCDSEYHTYCLNPPLARIPEGNWYCPSCIRIQSKKQDLDQHTEVTKRHMKRHLGEEGRAFQEALYQLACTMEEREYWEYSVEERIFLLKFLCDEVLNTALVREHLDQCTEKSNDLQQKIRTLVMEWRNLKFKEELLALSIAKESTSKFNEPGDVASEEGEANMYSGHGRLVEYQQNVNNSSVTDSGNRLTPSFIIEGCPGEDGRIDFSKSVGQLFKSSVIDTLADGRKSQVQSGERDVLEERSVPGNLNPNTTIGKEDQINEQDERSLLVSAQQDNKESTEESIHGFQHEIEKRELLVKESSLLGRPDLMQAINMKRNAGVLTNADNLHGSFLGSDSGRLQSRENFMTVITGLSKTSGELLASKGVLQENADDVHVTSSEHGSSDLGMGGLKNEISHIEESIFSFESQLMMSSLRRDFLGRDSFGRLYWVIGRPGRHPWLVADGSITVPRERNKVEDFKDPKADVLMDMVSSCTVLMRTGPGGSDACSTSTCDMHDRNFCSFSLYESDNEIQEITSWLSDADPKERELKECILQWQRLVHQVTNHISNSSQLTSKSSTSKNCTVAQSLTTKATMILEAKYGPFLDPEVSEIPKRKGRKAKQNHEERMYRCECLEAIWPSRHHCLSCHQSFLTALELEGHNDGRCTPNNPVSDESKENDDILRVKGTRSESSRGKENPDDVDFVETSKNKIVDASSNLVRISRKACPYDFDEISKRFITRNSNKELVQEIGLIGLNGLPSFVPSPVFFLNSALVLNPSLKSDTDMNSELAFASEGWLLSSMQRGGKGISATQDETGKGTRQANISAHNFHGNVNDEQSQRTKKSNTGSGDGEEASSITNKIQRSGRSCTVPESSLRPLVGKISEILKRLKVNLLDMEAALPMEALRPSRSQMPKICAWRGFVKSSESIFEMVQATTLFEGMIKTEYLKNGWWYWSSQTAAAKTSTVASLALRIYTLDDSIIYVKDQVPGSDPTENLKQTTKTGKKRKDIEL